MVDIAVTDPKTFLHEFEGGSPALREPVVQGRVEGLLGGPDTHIAIDLALNPPASAIGNPHEFIVHKVEQSHLELNFILSYKEHEPEVLSFSWGSTNPGQPSEIPPPPPVAPPSPDEALSTLTGLTDNPDWLIV
jgi:hypothetical protein